MHLFVDISSHGFGHLAITAPILNRLAEQCPDLRLSVRTALPAAQLGERIRAPFELIAAASDFGFVMFDATRVDLAASAAAYRATHADWAQRVTAEAVFLRGLRPDLILSNISYLPLAGAAQAGLPAWASCCLNWADLFAHFFAGESWAAPIHQAMLAAYRSAERFLRLTPGMEMPSLERCLDIPPVAALGRRHALGPAAERRILVAMGGISHRLPIDDWPVQSGLRWLVPRAWQCRHPQAQPWEDYGLNFTDMLASVDAVLTKPGYGTFTEAACNGIPVLYQRRQDWPEQESLIAWLHAHNRAACVADADLIDGGGLATHLAALWQQALPPRPPANGAEIAAQLLRQRLYGD